MDNPDTDTILANVKQDPTVADAVTFNWRGAQIHVKTGSGIDHLSFKSYAPKLDELQPCYQDEDNSALVEMDVVAGRCYPLPGDLFGCRYLVFVGNVDVVDGIELSEKA